MHHHHGSDGARAQSPRVLPHALAHAVLILEHDLEDLGEFLTQRVYRRGLDPTARALDDESFQCGRRHSAGEFLALALDAFDHGDCKKLLVDFAVKLQHLLYLCIRFFLCGERRVSFLPQKLSASDEGSRILELPSHDVAPLVELQGKISVSADPLREARVHDRLACGTDCNRDFEIRASGFGHPCDFRCESCHMLLLFAQGFLVHEEWEVGVVDSHGLDLCVQEALDGFPDGIGPWSKDVAA